MKSLFSFLLIFISLNNDKLIPTKITDDITVSIPKNFKPMKYEDMKQAWRTKGKFQW